MNATQGTAVKNLLIKARASIAEGWTQGYSAKDKAGDFVEAKSPTATCWCAIGAIDKHAIDDTASFAAINRLEPFTLPIGIATWNDEPGRTQAEVLALFDKAIIAILPGKLTRKESIK